ncbi:MAG: glycosyltransferase [Nitrospinae bacterium]|nr:glycosyltransferase [Nitrospinota bacterium]
MEHWDSLAPDLDQYKRHSAAYHKRLAGVYRFIIPQGSRVLEMGCGRGDLLAALKPGKGVGVDFSAETILAARQRHPQLEFINADAHDLDMAGEFDFIILSDLLNDLWDAQQALERVRKLCSPRTRVVMNLYSKLWEAPLSFTKRLGLSTPNLTQNWLTVEDVANLLSLTDLEMIRSFGEVMLPLDIPAVTTMCNRYLVKLWPLRHLALTNFIVARPVGFGPSQKPVVSVLVPARNEAGNVPDIFRRVPQMGAGTELIFVEGHSKDDTYSAIEREINNHPGMRVKLLKQTGKGKGNAVREGFTAATGDVLMILDADLTVPPEDLPRFLEVITSGKGEFVNGVRLVYPMEDQAMRFLNLLGNKFFSLAFSWLLGQPVKDTLCGTKVLRKSDYENIAANRSYFGDFDPFGDFDLIFGAAKANMKIVDLPVRYRARLYGETNINRWSHGALLLRMVAFAMSRIKFI